MDTWYIEETGVVSPAFRLMIERDGFKYNLQGLRPDAFTNEEWRPVKDRVVSELLAGISNGYDHGSVRYDGIQFSWSSKQTSEFGVYRCYEDVPCEVRASIDWARKEYM